MHASPPPDPTAPPVDQGGPWYKLLNRYHWYVLTVAALGWLFDTMDQQLFVLARGPALTALLGPTATTEDVKYFGGLATAIFIVGWATGGLIFGLFGDRLGRARTMVLTILIYSAFTGLSAISQGFLDFAFYRFLTGVGVGGEFAAGVTLVAEVMPHRARPYALGLLQALSALGNMAAAVVSYVIGPSREESLLAGLGLQGIQGWRLMFLVGILPAFLVIFIRRGLKEPESWEEAKRISQDDYSKQMGDLKELFGVPRWRHHAIIGILLAMVGVMGVWGIAFFSPELIRSNMEAAGYDRSSQDSYASIAYFLQNLAAFFGIYAFTIIAGWIGRRPAFALGYLMAFAATVMVFGFMTEPEQIFWMIPILGFCTLMVFGGYAIYFPELFPTRLRATGTGFCYNVARYLAAVAPFLLGQFTLLFAAAEGTSRHAENLSELTWLSSVGGSDAPFRYAALTVALIYLFGILILPFAPETKDKPLPE